MARPRLSRARTILHRRAASGYPPKFRTGSPIGTATSQAREISGRR